MRQAPPRQWYRASGFIPSNDDGQIFTFPHGVDTWGDPANARALWGDMYEDPAKKVLSVMYISLGDTARKQFKYKHHITTLWDSKAAELSRLTNECFQVNRNCTLGGHRSFSQLQQPGKSP